VPVRRTLRDPPQRQEDRRRPILRARAQRRRVVEDPMLIAQVVEAEAQVVRHPGVVVGRAAAALRRR
jgi:hypothetical protein